MMRSKKKDKYTFSNISPNEIFLDSENIPAFDKQQYEGRAEKAVSHRFFLFLGAVFALFVLALWFRAGYLQIIKGKAFAERANSNHLRVVPILAERGLIYDRNGEILAWNDPVFHLIFDKEAAAGQEEILTPRLSEFFKAISGAEKIAIDKDKLLEKLKNSDKDLILGTFYDWQEVNDLRLAFGDLPLRTEPASFRTYKELTGLSHAVGYMGYPSQADLEKIPAAVYEEMIGKAGIEKEYNGVLRGEAGSKIVELDSQNEAQSESIRKPFSAGKNIKLSIDSRVQNKIFEIIKNLSAERGFEAGASVIIDVSDGELLSLVSFPEYDSSILTRGTPKEFVNAFLNDPKKPFLNRSISGIYPPGSVVKPFVALAALNEKVISPEKQILSTGSISVPNPYYPSKPSIFRDWKAHGWTDMRTALAVSSDVYFYSVGGGFGDIQGLGIKRIGQYFDVFGFGKPTGIDLLNEASGTIPSPELKAKNNKNDPVWRVGDTYNASIGQGDFQVTPIQMAVAVAELAREGAVVKPHMVLGEGGRDNGQLNFNNAPIPAEYFKVVKEGMRKAVLEGTAVGLSGLPVHIAAKTGTAELGSAGKLVNSWVIAFWPYENPRYAAVFVMERGSASNLIGGVFALRQLMDWMSIHTPEYLTP